jgi:hypothetical protein
LLVQSKRGQFETESSSEGSTVNVSYDETFEARARICSVSFGPLGMRNRRCPPGGGR